MRRFIGAAVLFAGLTTGAVAGQDGAITLKFKKADPGERVRETKTETSTSKLTATRMGLPQNHEEVSVGRFAFTDEIVEKPKDSPRPTKLKRTYETAEVTKNGQATDLGLAGKTVQIEKRGDKYTFTVGGQPVTGPAAEMLGKEFNTKYPASEDDFLPGKPVKVGESWPVNVAKLSGELTEGGVTIDEKKSSAKAKLVKVYDKDGRRYGVIEVDIDLAVTGLQGGVRVRDGDKLTVRVVLDGCVDGTEAAGGVTMTMKGSLTGEVMGASLTLGIDAKVEGRTAEVTGRK